MVFQFATTRTSSPTTRNLFYMLCLIAHAHVPVNGYVTYSSSFLQNHRHHHQQQQQQQQLVPVVSRTTKNFHQKIVTYRSLPNKTSIRHTTAIMMAGSGTNDASSSSSSSSTLHHRSNYNLCKWLFAVTAFAIFVIPDMTWTVRVQQLASKWGGASGFGIGAYLFHLLNEQEKKEANMGEEEQTGKQLQKDIDNDYNENEDNDDYSLVDFYKRSQLGLIGFCSIGLLAIPGEAGFWPSLPLAMTSSLILTLVKMLGLRTAILGYYRTNNTQQQHQQQQQQQLSSWKKELWYGMLDNLKGLKVTDQKRAGFYRNSLLVIWLAIISNASQGLFQLRYKDALGFSTFSVSLHTSAVARLFLISSLVFSLKSVAETTARTLPPSPPPPTTTTKRQLLLQRSLYWKLNWSLAVWSFLVGLGQSISYPFVITPSRGVVMFSFSALLFLKGYKGYKEYFS